MGGKRGNDGDGGSKKKARYHKKSVSGAAFPSGSKGIFITCDTGREDKAADETAALIEEHYDKLSGSKDTQPQQQGDKGHQDMAAALAAEVAQLKDKKQRRFKTTHPGVRGCTFIEFPIDNDGPDPIQVTVAICEEAVANQRVRCRYVHRLIPIMHTCFASVDDMKTMAAQVIPSQFPKEGEQGVDFAVDYEHRSTDKFDRMAVIDAFVDQVKTPPNKVNLGKPEKCILVQAVRNACGMSVVPKYRELHKYNLKRCAGLLDDDVPAKPKPASATTEAKAETTTDKPQADKTEDQAAAEPQDTEPEADNGTAA